MAAPRAPPPPRLPPCARAPTGPPIGRRRRPRARPPPRHWPAGPSDRGPIGRGGVTAVPAAGAGSEPSQPGAAAAAGAASGERRSSAPMGAAPPAPIYSGAGSARRLSRWAPAAPRHAARAAPAPRTAFARRVAAESSRGRRQRSCAPAAVRRADGCSRLEGHGGHPRKEAAAHPHTHPPTITPPAPPVASRRSPCREGAAPLPPPGSRGARPEDGGGREAVPGLPRWSGSGTGERRGRRVESYSSPPPGCALETMA
ncbi:translation initiation factor IF-2-like [Corvus hawaiiensis]|uniref:translation initiation factor IF-2-like n=1 Tax=Corvus hawaiiensis TaxID=134902 RepID=UPI002019794E|nr:translation initiation factor IF-2-like [Corvus hawaiiensis]